MFMSFASTVRKFHSSSKSFFPCYSPPRNPPSKAEVKKFTKLYKFYREFKSYNSIYKDRVHYSPDYFRGECEKYSLEYETCKINSVLYDIMKNNDLPENLQTKIKNNLSKNHYKHRVEDISARKGEVIDNITQLDAAVNYQKEYLNYLENINTKQKFDFENELFWNSFKTPSVSISSKDLEHLNIFKSL